MTRAPLLPENRRLRADGKPRLILIGAAVLAAHLALLAWLDAGQTPVQNPTASLTVRVLAPAASPAPSPAAPTATKPATDARQVPLAQPGRARPNHARAAQTPAATSAPLAAATAPSATSDHEVAAQPAAAATAGLGDNAAGLPAHAPALAPADAIQSPSSKADYLNNPPPAYPAISRRLGEQGQVVIAALISKDGVASQTRVEQSSGFQRLDQAALETVRRWRFVPGRRAGVAQDMWFRIPISFSLD